VTDGQTDGRTELRWLRRAIAVPAVARKNCSVLENLFDLHLVYILNSEYSVRQNSKSSHSNRSSVDAEISSVV